MLQLLQWVNRIVWGVPALIAIIGVGVYLSVRTRCVQLRLFPKALRLFVQQFCGKNEDGSQSQFRSLCTALAATVGTGNLAGVAGAIAIGGPGAIFWMWVCGILGMGTKFAEATLAVRYRRKNKSGEYIGGPMYLIEQGMGHRWKWLAGVYCFLTLVASFGVGNATQMNAVICGINSVVTAFGGEVSVLGNLLMGIALALLICFMLFGGAKRVGETAERLVPFASIAYLLLGCVVLIGRFEKIPIAFQSILQGAFSPNAVTGGVIGSVLTSLRVGASRGVFTNEAGMGTASIAHAGADVSHPVQQGMMGIVEVFLDTIVICTMTALVILCSGIAIPYGVDVGIELTSKAFESVLGKWSSILIALSLICFAIATVLGWGFYGARSAEYLFGENSWKKFAIAQAVTVIVSSVLGTGTVWMVAETVNGLMAIPNLIALAVLTPELTHIVRNYEFKYMKTGKTLTKCT